MSAYENTSVPVAQSVRQIEELLTKRGVTDRRTTQTAALFALDFNWPLREPCRRRRDGFCEAHRSWDRKPEHSPLRTILGVRMVVPWPADERERRRMARVLFWHLKSKLEDAISEGRELSHDMIGPSLRALGPGGGGKA